MANRVIRILPRTLFNLSGVAAGTSVVFGIAGPIDVSEYSEITSYVRFHQGSSVANDPTLAQVQYYANGTTDEDPAALTTAAVPGFGFQVLTAVTGFAGGLKSTPSGFMKVTAVPSTVGSSLNVALAFVPATAGTFQLIMSIDLICKNRDPGPRDLEEERDPILSEVMD
ncbi:MAG: hypothetical protein U0234_07515 [Sandaracinus sp.]